jgi:predicted  nucleic acid-binding Zn-ribbon protein
MLVIRLLANTSRKENQMSEREQYVEKAKAQIDRWNAEIDKLQTRANKAKSDAKIEYQRQINDLRGKRDEAVAKAKELQDASDDAWADTKTGFDNAWNSFSKAFQNAMSRFR